MTAPVTLRSARRPDRSSPTPLWAQVSADLRRRCESGDFEEGVPGEFALGEEYGVSRHTVREALRALRAEGLISSGRGRPSVVRGRYSQTLGSVYSLFQSIEAQGATQTSDVLRLETTTDADAAARLGLADDALLVVLERVRRADDEALAHDTSWLPHSLAHPLLTRDFRRTALYEELARIGVTIESGHEWMSADVAEERLAALLDLPVGAAVLHVDRVATAMGRPVEWRQTQVRGDAFTVETDWSTSGVSLSLSGTPTP
ncbi:MAG: UTRA domain-containing protein [Actinomycetales bacterium]|nr:UTRA domain-containing protein [Actinomycetales bacterium]